MVTVSKAVFVASGVISLDDVGPINPTELRYGVEHREEPLYIAEELPDLNPQINVASVSQVYEDGTFVANAVITGGLYT